VTTIASASVILLNMVAPAAAYLGWFGALETSPYCAATTVAEHSLMSRADIQSEPLDGRRGQQAQLGGLRPEVALPAASGAGDHAGDIDGHLKASATCYRSTALLRTIACAVASRSSVAELELS
jgi:hypothetical protein